METDPRFKKKMHYADDGTPLGYIWQVAEGYDPFAEWRERWAKEKELAEQEKKKPKPKPEQSQETFPDYGYGKGRYTGD